MLTVDERAAEASGGRDAPGVRPRSAQDAIGRGAQDPWRAVKRLPPPGPSQKPLAFEIARAVSRVKEGMGPSIWGMSDHAPVLGIAGIAGFLHHRARNDLGLDSLVAHALAHRPAVPRRRGFAMGWRGPNCVGTVAAPQFVCAFCLGRSRNACTDRAADASRGDRLLPPRAQSDLCRVARYSTGRSAFVRR